MRILLTEDDQDLAGITAFNLKKEGFAVDLAYTGEETLCLLESNGEYDAVILDLNLPDLDGFALLRNLKLIAPEMPILALTARDAEEDRIKGFKQGLDDYLTKPFSYHELAARIRLLYRSQPSQADKTIQIGVLKVNPQRQTVVKDGLPIELTLNEFRILHYLVKNKGRAISTKELLTEIWDNNDCGDPAKVFTTVSRLRKKLDNHKDRIIKTDKEGYIIS